MERLFLIEQTIAKEASSPSSPTKIPQKEFLETQSNNNNEKKAENLQTTSLKEQKVEIVKSLNLLGRSFQLIHDFKNAIHLHQQALDILKAIDEETVDCKLLIIDLQKDIGDCYQGLEMLDDAHKFYLKAETTASTIDSFMLYLKDEKKIRKNK